MLNVTITDRAKDYLKSVVNNDYVTLGVKGGGCAGFGYEWTFEDESKKDDDLD